MQPCTSDKNPYRLYAIMRGDLNMPAGKLAAQAGHAFLNAYLISLKQQPDVAEQYQSDGNGTKICLEAKNEEEILATRQLCIDQNIPCSLIVDRDHILLPHFTGKPIITGLGIGPIRRNDIQHITGRFHLSK